MKTSERISDERLAELAGLSVCEPTSNRDVQRRNEATLMARELQQARALIASLKGQLADQMSANENMVREKDQLSVELATLKQQQGIAESIADELAMSHECSGPMCYTCAKIRTLRSLTGGTK